MVGHHHSWLEANAIDQGWANQAGCAQGTLQGHKEWVEIHKDRMGEEGGRGKTGGEGKKIKMEKNQLP